MLAALATIHCGSTIDDSNTAQAPACSLGDSSLGDIRPAQPVDYLEIRKECCTASNIWVLRSTGERCKTATNAAGCEAAYDGVVVPATTLGGGFFVVFTRGDEVGAIGSADDLRAFLGPVDTADEAIFVASTTVVPTSLFEQFSFDCANTVLRAAGDGFDIVARAQEASVAMAGCGYRWRAWLHVAAPGAVTIVASEHDGSPCPTWGAGF
jgi:hypothetical protein